MAIGGGHGLAASLRALRHFAGSITAVVSIADDGGSTGRVRETTSKAAPGDLRKALGALSSINPPLVAALEYRFHGGDLDGHATGNLLIAALADVQGDLVAALDTVGGLVGAVGRVLPATSEPVDLVGSTWDGDVVVGQATLTALGSIKKVCLDPRSPASPSEVPDAVLNADLVVLGPGSLYTSVLAASVVPAVRESLAATSARVVYVCNLRPEHPETDRFDLADHLDALRRHDVRFDDVLHDPSFMTGAARSDRAVSASLAAEGGMVHDVELLGAELERLIV